MPLAVPMPLRRFFSDALDFAYPGTCAACESPCDGGAFLCPICTSELDVLTHAPACERCAMPLGSHGAPCPYCHGKGPPHFDRIVRLGVFVDPLKQAIHHLKYHRRWPLGEQLADRLLQAERTKGLLTEMQAIVPVPLHFWRHVSRGYNQADVIAARVGHACKIPIVHAVRRTRNTETQTHLSRAKRHENLKDAFSLRRAASSIRGKHVLVVDDVMTTGETLRAVARVLKAAEPASLCALVLAIADPRHRDFEAI